MSNTRNSDFFKIFELRTKKGGYYAALAFYLKHYDFSSGFTIVFKFSRFAANCEATTNSDFSQIRKV